MNSSAAMTDIERRIDAFHMARALRLAEAGRGRVEPNPLVGCIIAQGAEIIGEGWHQRFGGPHAEIEALAVAGRRAAGATMYVTLEPCCHQGKTPPCTQAVIAAGLRRVVVAARDPFPPVDGSGIAALEAAGIAVDVGLREDSARTLNAPYLKLLATGRPWVIAKWAMTLDGKIAARGGSSRWISSAASRRIAHALRGRVDAIVVGRGTAATDDPLLTARPSGPRIATRIVLDTAATLATDRQLVRTARQTPLLVVVGPRAAAADRQRLEAEGCEILVCDAATPRAFDTPRQSEARTLACSSRARPLRCLGDRRRREQQIDIHPYPARTDDAAASAHLVVRADRRTQGQHEDWRGHAGLR